MKVLQDRVIRSLVAVVTCMFCARVFATEISNVSASSPINGEPILVSADVTGVSPKVYLVYGTATTDTINYYSTNVMSSVDGTTYSSYIPPLSIGDVHYFVYAVDGGEQDRSEEAVATFPAVPDFSRYAMFNTTLVSGMRWVIDVGTNYVCELSDGRKWTASGVGPTPGTATAYSFPGADIPLMRMWNYPNSSKVNITSPELIGGVGTIYYTSKMYSKLANGRIAVQISEVADPEEDDWVTVKELNYERADSDEKLTLHAAPVLVNNYDVKRVRFLRTRENEYNTGRAFGVILFDNIVISKPPAKAYMTDVLRNPGYPANGYEVKMRVNITNECDSTPAVNRRPKLWYKWVLSAEATPSTSEPGWQAIDMYQKDGDLYECVIPADKVKVGYIWYYYQCDFDGYSYGRDPDAQGSEEYFECNKSPTFWANGQTYEKRPTSLDMVKNRFQVRAYKSEFSSMQLDAQPADAAVKNMTLVGDEIWQCVTLVTGIPRIETYFVGYNHYTNDATEFAAEPVRWGENDQGRLINPVLSGKLEQGATNALVAELEYDGFLLYRIDVNNDNDYLVKRAVYQDFNEWQATEESFEESLGLYKTQTESTDFRSWPVDEYADYQMRSENFDADQNGFQLNTVLTPENWLRSNSKTVVNRKKVFNANASDPTQSVALNIGGSVGNRGDVSYTIGVKELSYMARATIDDAHYALYKNGTGWPLGSSSSSTFKTVTRFNAADMADTKCYVSFLFGYKPGAWYDEGDSYYEVRMVQTDVNSQASDNDKAFMFELWRTVNGAAAERVAVSGVYTGMNLADNHEVTINSWVESNRVVFRINYKLKTEAASGNIDLFDYSSARLTSGGTIGFGCYDVSPRITSCVVSTPNLGNIISLSDDWYLGGRRSDDAAKNRWELTGMVLSRPVPSMELVINAAAITHGATIADPDDMVPVATNFVNTLSLKQETVDFLRWNPQFVQIFFLAGDAGVVVDDVSLTPWRAKTRNELDDTRTDIEPFGGAKVDGVNYYDWNDREQENLWLNDQKGWALLQGWVTPHPRVIDDNCIVLEKSRANPPTDDDGQELPLQAIVSPVLSNGIGSISFSVEALAGTCVYAVERNDVRAYNGAWSTCAIYTNVFGSQQSVSRYCKIAETNAAAGGVFEGRIRVRLLPESSTDAKLMLDNIIAKDYPPRDSTSWYSYNTRISSITKITGDNVDDSSRLYNASGRSCFLNNDYHADVSSAYGDEGLPSHQPYVQTPMNGKGVGEISFQYRIYNSGDENTLVIKGAASEDTPDEQWQTIDTVLVSNNSYVQYQNTTFDYPDVRFVRFYSQTAAGKGRICLDNILVTEPAKPGYEFLSVGLVPAQPVVGSNTYIEATIGRFLMDPRNVRVFASFHHGVDNWGYTNWWSKPNLNEPLPDDVVELYRVGDANSRVYRSADPIPSGNVDEVFQYIAWGVHADINATRAIMQSESSFIFNTETNGVAYEVSGYCPWYLPVNLNVSNANKGWSPYYYIYSCAPGSVWINEVHYISWKEKDKVHNAEFLELAGFANSKIGGWKFDVVNSQNLPYGIESMTVNAGETLSSVGNGWGFFVIGTITNADQVVSELNSKDCYIFQDEEFAGVAMYRSMGALEQKICWGYDNNHSKRDNLAEYGYEYIGEEPSTGGGISMGLSNDSRVDEGSRYKDFVWPVGLTRTDITPGAANIGQSFLDIGSDIVTYFIHSVIGSNGKQDGGDTTLITIEVEEGSSTNIVYVANDWYRIEAVVKDGAAVTAAAGAKTYNLEINNISADVTNNVTFAPMAINGKTPTTAERAWLIANGKSDTETFYGDITEKYTYGLDPTIENSKVDSLVITAFAVDTTTATATVQLNRTGKISDTAPLNGVTLVISGGSDIANVSDWEVIETANITDASFSDGDTAIATISVSPAYKFLRAKIQ